MGWAGGGVPANVTNAAGLGVHVQSDGSVLFDGPKLGFFGAAPVIQGAAITQTYSTAARTHPVMTAAAVASTASTQVTPFGFTTAAQADAIPTAINALEADLLAVKKLLNALINDHRSLGLLP